jgi:hypothetical protein
MCNICFANLAVAHWPNFVPFPSGRRHRARQTVSVPVTSDLPAFNWQKVQEEAFALWGWRTGRTRCAKPFSQAATSDSLAAAAKNDLSCRRPMKELPAISRGAFSCGASSRRLGLFPSTSFRQSFLLACCTGVSYFRSGAKILSIRRCK